MEKWEYLTVQLQPKIISTGKLLKPTTSLWDAGYFSEQLNTYGLQGWELVSCFCTEAQAIGGSWSGGTNGVFAAFKRRIIS